MQGKRLGLQKLKMSDAMPLILGGLRQDSAVTRMIVVVVMLGSSDIFRPTKKNAGTLDGPDI